MLKKGPRKSLICKIVSINICMGAKTKKNFVKTLLYLNKPVLLVENNDSKINSFLNSLNYKEIISKKKSRNKIFAHKKKYDFKNII